MDQNKQNTVIIRPSTKEAGKYDLMVHLTGWYPDENGALRRFGKTAQTKLFHELLTNKTQEQSKTEK